MDVIPFYIGVGILGCLTLYQLQLSRSFDGAYKDKLFYYYSNLITLIPVVLYTYQIINMNMLGIGASMQLFYLEWTFATPLIIINIGRLLNISLFQYILTALIDVSMILFGYISYISNDSTLVYTFYGLGCACFVTLLTAFLLKFRMFQKAKTNLPVTSIYRDRSRYSIFRAIIMFIASTWIFYPIVHILYKEAIIAKTTVIPMYITLDILTKGVFTCLLLGSREIYKSVPSWLGVLAKKIFKIHPLTATISENQLEESIEYVASLVTPTLQQPQPQPQPQTTQTPIVVLTYPSYSHHEKRVAHVESIGVDSSSHYTHVVTGYIPSVPSIVEETIP